MINYNSNTVRDGFVRPTDERGDDDEQDTNASTIPCSRCGLPTTFDPTYGDLCYRCCRADNE